MASRTLPGIGLNGFWALGESGWKPGADTNWLTLSVLSQCSVLSRSTALPGSPSEGQVYIVPSGGDANKIAIRDAGIWVYLTPSEGWLAYVRDEDRFVVFDGSSWGLLLAPVSTFLSMTDTPSTYTEQRGRVPRVNSAANALEFSDENIITTATAGFSLSDVLLSGGQTVIVTSATDVTVTVPPGLTRKGAVSLIQGGAGKIVLSPGVGVTLRAPDNLLKTRVENSMMLVLPRTDVAETYQVAGDLTA